MSDKKFDFTVDDIIAEFDKKKSEPSAAQDNIQNDDFSEEFSKELSAEGEYVPRHLKPASPEDNKQSSEETAETALPQEVTDAPAENTKPFEETENSADNRSSSDEKSDVDNTGSNIFSDDNKEEINEVQEFEQNTAPQAVLNGVIPVKEFSDSSEDEDNNSFRSVFENGLDATAAETESEIETVQILAANIPDWNDLVPDIQETTSDSPEPEGEELEEEEAEPSEADNSSDNSAEPADDEIIEDDAPEENAPEADTNADDTKTPEEENTPAEDIPPFEPEPLDKDALNADKTPEKEKKNILKELLPWKGDSVFEMIRKVVFIIAVIIFVGAGIMLASTLIQSNRAKKDLEEIKGIVTTTAKTTIDSDGNVVTVAPTDEEEKQHNIDIMSYYKEISDKVVAFIELEGCDIYQPVVQDPNDTANEYYLTHTYYDEPNKGGAIFMDYRCWIRDNSVSPNIVLYGHNQEDGTMFGNLKNYKKNTEFYAENPVITLRTEYETGTYLIYAYFVTNALAKQDSNGEVFHYHDYIGALSDEATFDWYMGEVQSRNQIISPVTAEFGDKLLVLSTCSNEFSNSRFVVFARKLRDGESVSDYDFTETTLNPKARGVDWDAILSDETSETEETTVPEEDDEDSDDTTLKRLTKRKNTEAEEENTDEEASDSEDTSDNDSDETTSSKKKTTTAETEEETTTTKKTKKTTAEEETTTKKTTKKTAKETSSDAEDSTVTSVPETEKEETTTVTAGSAD